MIASVTVWLVIPAMVVLAALEAYYVRISLSVTPAVCLQNCICLVQLRHIEVVPRLCFWSPFELRLVQLL